MDQSQFKCAFDEIVSIDTLIPNPKNPNKHPKKQIELLSKIIKTQGQRAPIVVSKRSGFITKGHGRLEAIKALGWTHAAVDFQEYESEAMEYADMVADNKIAELAHTDMKFVIDTLPSAGIGLDFDFDLLGVPDFREDFLDNVQVDLQTEGEMGWSKELDEKNDYIVLLFDSKESFKQACEKFGIETVKTNLSTSGNPNFMIEGIGRVVDGKAVIEKL